MKEPVVVKVNVGAALNGVFMGRRETLVADELRHSGIPAHGGASGIIVSEGTLEVNEEDGLRVFTWTPPDQVVKVPVPAGDNNLEVQALEEQTEERKADEEELAQPQQPAAPRGKKRS